MVEWEQLGVELDKNLEQARADLSQNSYCLCAVDWDERPSLTTHESKATKMQSLNGGGLPKLNDVLREISGPAGEYFRACGWWFIVGRNPPPRTDPGVRGGDGCLRVK